MIKIEIKMNKTLNFYQGEISSRDDDIWKILRSIKVRKMKQLDRTQYPIEKFVFKLQKWGNTRKEEELKIVFDRKDGESPVKTALIDKRWWVFDPYAMILTLSSK